MKITQLCISFLIIIAFPHTLQQHPGQYTSCVTSQNEPGYCKKLNKCPHVFGKVSISQLQKLIKICSTDPVVDNFPVVCCVDLDPRHTMCRSRDEYWELGNCKQLIDCPVLAGIKNETKRTALISQRSGICSDVNKLCCPQKPDFILAEVQLPIGGSDCSCGCVSQERRRISNGEKSRLGAWPWLARLGYLQNVLHFKCAGSLITNSHVLTAAHCIRSELLLIRLGEYDTSTDRETNHLDVNIWKIFMHESYDDVDNDIALLYLDKAVQFTDLIKPVCLPNSLKNGNLASLNGRVSYVAGWGSEFEISSANVNILREVELEIFDNIRCALYDNFANDTMICAGGLDGRDACKGDSGGPLMIQETNVFYTVGVVSFGIGCGRREYPGVYTNIPHFMDWITNNTKRLH